LHKWKKILRSEKKKEILQFSYPVNKKWFD
jgi:hypothetical protein